MGGLSKGDLLKAAKRGDVAMVQRCLNAGVDIHATDWGGDCALHKAASKGHVEVVLQLLGANAPMDEPDVEGSTALHMAAEKGHLKVVHQLLLAGSAVNRANKDGWTPLHYAAYSGHLEVVEHLLQGGAAARAVDKKGKTPADVCGTDVFSRNRNKDDIQNALKAAEGTQQKEVAVGGEGVDAGQVQLKADGGGAVQGLAARDLLKAAKAGNVAMVQRCLEAGVDISCKDWAGYTPLHLAAASGRVQVARLLLREGAEADGGWTGEQSTPLHEAAIWGQHEVVRELLRAGASVKVTDRKGWTVLHRAAYHGRLEMVETLLRAGAAADAKNKKGNTPADECWFCLSKANKDAVHAALEAAGKIQQARAWGATQAPGVHESPWAEAARSMPIGVLAFKQWHVFISHAGNKADKPFAHQLYRLLQNHFGMKAFLDEESLCPGGNALPQMRQAMETSHIGLLLLSWEFLERGATMDELSCLLELHRRNRIILLPVFLRITVEECLEQLPGDSQRICGISGVRHVGALTRTLGVDGCASKTEEETTFEIAHKLCQMVFGATAEVRFKQGADGARARAESAPQLPSL